VYSSVPTCFRINQVLQINLPLGGQGFEWELQNMELNYHRYASPTVIVSGVCVWQSVYVPTCCRINQLEVQNMELNYQRYASPTVKVSAVCVWQSVYMF
jgi:hypothetical protein